MREGVAGPRRRALRRAVTALAALFAALLVAGPAHAVPPVEDGTPPPEKACRYRDRQWTSRKLTGTQLSDRTWPQARLGYLEAHRYTRGRGVMVAVVDSGVDSTHPQLRGAVRTGVDVTRSRAVAGAATDCASHGTMVAGIIAARPAPGVGLVGVAPEAQIWPVRHMWGVSAYGSQTSGSAAALVRGMRAAVTSGASVVNVSVSVTAVSLSAAERAGFQEVVDLAAARDVLIVAATGNTSEYDGKSPATYPAQLSQTSPNVMAVAGITPDGRPDEDSVSGSFVSVAAPGRAMPCLMDRGGLVPCDGTSFAAPFVSGLAALVRSRFPDLSAAQVRSRIEATADHPSTDLPDPRVGFGVVNPVAALTTVLTGTSPEAVAAPAAPMPRPPSDDALRRTTTLVAAGSVGLVAVVLAGWATARHGRRRHWRPGTRPRPS